MVAPGLQEKAAMRGQGDRDEGFTLVELMIVVVIVAILAGVAMYVYGRSIKKARLSEVTEIFGEFSAKEEAFHAEFGRYLGAPGGENDYYPASISSSTKTDATAGRPDYWNRLRIKAKDALWCQYSATAGSANDGTGMGSAGAQLWSGATPTTNWFYLKAQCDMDGNASVNSIATLRGDKPQHILWDDKGR